MRSMHRRLGLLFAIGFVLHGHVPDPLDPMRDVASGASAVRANVNAPVGAACFAPGTSQAVISAFNASHPPPPFFSVPRWSATALDPAGGTAGAPTIVTYGFVPDGTPVPSAIGEPASPSALFAYLNGIYGSPLTWRPLFDAALVRWSTLTGVTFVYEPNDDGSPLFNGTGVAGVRADIRISGHFMDGPSNVLAFNAYPQNGDMVIDTGDDTFLDTSGNSLLLRNLIDHEVGHGIGIQHVCPSDSTKLMEPYVSTSFAGPQHDDLRAADSHYGDALEPNNALAVASAVGNLTIGGTLEPSLLPGAPPNSSLTGVDVDGDEDWLRVDLSAEARVHIAVAPVGLVYDSSPQNTDGTCNSGSTFDSRAVRDLRIEVRAGINSTIWGSANATSSGGSESLSLILPVGPFYVRVHSTTTSGAGTQLYRATISAESAPACLPAFTSGVGYAELGPQAVAAGDFDGDHKLDIAVSSWDGASVSVRLGNGDGTFQSATSYAVGIHTWGVSAADLDGDGALDLVASSVASSSTQISMLRGTGNGTFQPAVYFATGAGPLASAVGDFNGDGRPDLAVVNFYSANVSILFGNAPPAAGTFQSPVNYAVSTNPNSIALGDFNGDGRPDLAVSNTNGNNAVSILLANGPVSGGTFAPAVHYTPFDNPYSIAIADLDFDGKLDLVVANKVAGLDRISVLRGNGNGTFQPPVNHGVGSQPSFVVARDFNGDGWPDLAVTNNLSHSISLLANSGGILQPAGELQAGINPGSLAAADFDNDGKPDLAVTNITGNSVQVLLNQSPCAGAPGISFCHGDATATPCPCLNTGAPGHGCPNSIHDSGARLVASGFASVANDSVVLTGSSMPDSSCLYFQGTSQQQGGLGTAFGDGLRCASGSVIRLVTRFNTGGSSQYPTAGDPTVSVRGSIPPAGGTRTYQAWYRNAAAYCTASTFNLTNGLQITWSR
jgi:hypothetical protein